MGKILYKVQEIDKLNVLELEKPGIYLLYNNEELIYIGESKNLIRRLFCNHRNGSKRNSTLIRRLLRGNLGMTFFNEEDVKYFIKTLKIKVIIDETLNNKNNRKNIEQKLKKILKPRL